MNGRRALGCCSEDPFSLSERNPNSNSRRMASERFIPSRLAHALMGTMRDAGSRTVTSGSSPIAGRRLFFGVPFFMFR